MNGTKFIENIDQLLEIQGKTRSEMINDLGFTTQNLADWKRRNVPSVDICLKISRYLGVSIEYLVLGREQQVDDDIENALALLKQIPKERRAPLMAIIKSQVEFWKNEK